MPSRLSGGTVRRSADILLSSASEPSGADHAVRHVGVPLAALFIASLALRPQLVGLGPLLPEIQTSLGISHGIAGLLATVPVLCMAVFALPGVRLAHVIGLRAAMTVALAAIAVFGFLRPMVPSFPAVLMTTVGIGIGIGGALLPRAVRMLIPHRVGFATGLYGGGIQTGAAIAAATAAPLAAVTDWRIALLVFSGATTLILAAWLVVTRSVPTRDEPDVLPSFPSRSMEAWRLATVFALNSLCYYGLITWLPSAYVDMGWTSESAGGLVGLLNLAALPACFVIPRFSDRSVSRHRYVVACGVGTGVAITGILLAPELASIWVTLAGVALGTLFPMMMALPVDIARRPADVAGHAAMMLTGGYAVAAAAPALLGWVRDASGSFAPAFWMLVVAAMLISALSVNAFASGSTRATPAQS